MFRSMLRSLGGAPRDVRVPTRLQFQTTECGLAALAMVLAHHGRHASPEALRELTGASRDCVSAAEIQRAARHFGLECKAYLREPANLADLPLPFLAHLRFIHFVVVEGFAGGDVLTVDPASGRSVVPAAAFDEAFTGVVLSFTRGPAFAAGGEAVHPLRALWRRTGAQARRLTGTALVTGVAGVLALAATPVVLGQWLDAASMPSGTGAGAPAWTFAGALAGLAALQAGLFGWTRSALAGLHLELVDGHAGDLLARYLAAPPGFFAYRLPSRLHDTLYAGEGTATAVCRDLLPGLLRVLLAPVAVAVMAVLHPGAGLLAAAVLVIQAALVAAALRWHRWAPLLGGATAQDTEGQLFDRGQLESAKLNGHAQEFVAGRLSGRARVVLTQQLAAGLGGWLRGGSAAVAIGLPLLTLPMVAQALQTKDASPGGALALVLLAGAAGSAQRGAWQLRSRWTALMHQQLPVQDVLDSVPAATTGPVAAASTVDPAELPGDVVLRASELVYGYSGTRPPQVRGITLELHRGEQLGITGPSGGGKSTLGSLLGGDLAPWSGAMTIAGGRVARVDKTSLFFEGSVRDNLCLWNAAIADAQVRQAVHDACLNDVLAARPGGLDAPVAPRGANFSGGQRQRLEIARALLLQPAILVLDEATDALDPALESQLRANLRARGCTLVVISHRASTLAACDRVLRVADGRLADAPDADGASAEPSHPMPAGPPVADTPEDGDACARADRAVLQAGLRRIALAWGIEAAPVPTSNAPPSLSALGAQAGLLVRRVRFADPAWWAWSHGALLAWCHKRASVVVRLPQGSGWHDAASGRALAIDAPSGIDPLAWACVPLGGDRPAPARDRLRVQIRATRGEWWAAAGVAIVLALTLLLLPLVAARTFASPVRAGLAQWVGVVLAATAIGLLEFALVRLLQRTWDRVDLAVVADFVQRLPRLAPAFLRDVTDQSLGRSMGALFTLLQRAQAATRPALEALVVLLALGWLATWEPVLALTGAAAAGFVIVGAWIRPRHVMQEEERLTPLRGSEVRFLFDALGGLARLRLLGRSAAALAHWHAQMRRNLADGRPLRAREQAPAWRRWTFAWLTLALVPVVLMAAHGLGAPVLSASHPERVAAGLIALWIVLDSALGLGQGLRLWRRGEQSAQQADLLCQAPTEPAPAASSPSAVFELQDVDYTWPGAAAPALSSVSLQARPGEFLAITGPSGSGKSTLLRLLLGLDKPARGRLQLDGSTLEGAALVGWRHAAGLVAQGDTLASAGTLRGQLCGAAQVDVQAVWRAVEIAQMAGDVRGMPMGLQTILETGKLSTGQEQRLLIARELLRGPRLLVLDEATNAIPEAMQASLFAALRSLGITCILVTHRQSALALMDRVVVLREGTVAWSGRPGEMAGQAGLLDMLQAERQEGHL